jgi:hypothetical protein
MVSLRDIVKPIHSPQRSKVVRGETETKFEKDELKMILKFPSHYGRVQQNWRTFWFGEDSKQEVISLKH